MRFCLAVSVSFLSVTALAQDVEQKISDAIESDARTEAEVDRDWDRSPLETLTFLGLRDDMRVLELLPGGGWYTKILAPVLRENGALYVAIGTNNVSENLVSQPGFDHVEVVDIGVSMERTGPFNTSFIIEAVLRNWLPSVPPALNSASEKMPFGTTAI